MTRQKKSSYRDMQILLAIHQLKKCSILELLNYCIDNYGSFAWDYHNIRNSIIRLYKNNKLSFTFNRSNIIYTFDGKEFKQERTIKYIIINGDENI